MKRTTRSRRMTRRTRSALRPFLSCRGTVPDEPLEPVCDQVPSRKATLICRSPHSEPAIPLIRKIEDASKENESQLEAFSTSLM